MAAALVLMLTQGCAYMKDRGNDLSDTFELGITVTPRLMPTFAARMNGFDVVSLGYSKSDLMLLGWTDRQFGVLRLQDDFWGVLAWGEERIAISKDGEQPQWSEDGWPPATSLPFEGREPYSVGFVGAFAGENRPPSRSYGECPKLLHLGWIGLYANCSMVDIADFFIGWSTLDIGADDAAD